MRDAPVVDVALDGQALAIQPRLHFGRGHVAGILGERLAEAGQARAEVVQIAGRGFAGGLHLQKLRDDFRHPLAFGLFVAGGVELGGGVEVGEVTHELEAGGHGAGSIREGDVERGKGLDGGGVVRGLPVGPGGGHHVSLAGLARSRAVASVGKDSSRRLPLA